MKKIATGLFVLFCCTCVQVFGQTGTLTERISNLAGSKIPGFDCMLVMDGVNQGQEMVSLDEGDANLAQLRNTVNQTISSFPDFKGKYNPSEWFGMKLSNGFYLSGALQNDEASGVYLDFVTDGQMNPRLFALHNYIFNVDAYNFDKEPFVNIKSSLEAEIKSVGKSWKDVIELSMYVCEKGMVQEVVVLLNVSYFDERSKEYKVGKAVGFYFDDQNKYIGKSEFTFETCFPADAQVMLADGSQKSIANLKAGDLLMGTGNEYGENQVIATAKHQGAHSLIELSVVPTSVNFASSQSANTPVYSLVCTPNHPISTPKGGVQAAALQTGDQVFYFETTTQQMMPAQVVAQQTYAKKVSTVYNLKTSAGHYWVNGVLVLVK